MMVAEKYDFHFLIYIFKIRNQLLQRLVTFIYQRQILIYITVITIRHLYMIRKVLIRIGISAVILHGNAHHEQLLPVILCLKLSNDFVVQFLVCNIFAHNFASVKIINKMHFIESHHRINLISAPSGRKIRMHGQTGISPLL